MPDPRLPSLPPAAVADLRVALGPEVVVHPHDPRYAALAGGAPCAAVVVAGDTDVLARVLPLAAAHDLEVEVPGQGSWAPRRAGSARPRLLVRLAGPAEVAVHPQSRTATVGATATWHDLLRTASAHALVCAPSVDLGSRVVDAVLLGSTGPVARSLGGCADPVRRLEVVDDAGVVRDVGPLTAPELFRVLRGGGPGATAGARVVVTRLVLGLVPDPGGEEVVVDLPVDARAHDLPAWWTWSMGLPEAVDSSVLLAPDGPGTLRVLRTGAGAPAPSLPGLHGTPLPLTRSGSLAALLLSQGPAGPGRLHRLAGPGATVDGLAAAAPGPGSPVRLRRLGGAAGRAPLVPDGWRGRGATHALDADTSPGPDPGTAWSAPDDGSAGAAADPWRRAAVAVASPA